MPHVEKLHGREILSWGTSVGVANGLSQNSYSPHTIAYIAQKSHCPAVKYMPCILDSARHHENTKEA